MELNGKEHIFTNEEANFDSEDTFWFDTLPVKIWSKILSYINDPWQIANLELVNSCFQDLAVISSWPQIHKLRAFGELQIQLGDSSPLRFPKSNRQQLLLLLNNLTKLTSISLTIRNSQEFDDFLQNLQVQFVVKMELTITCLFDRCSGHFSELISKAANRLKELELVFTGSVSNLDRVGEMQAAIVRCCQLESLSFYFLVCNSDKSEVPGDYISPVLSQGTLVNLKKLHLVIKPNVVAFNSIADSLMNCGAELVELKLHLRYREPVQLLNAYRDKVLGSESHPLESLRKLVLNTRDRRHDEELIAASLEAICPQLEEINLIFD